MYIARDIDGSLFLYENMPRKVGEYFDSQRGYSAMELPSNTFPEVTFENSPQKVELKLVKNDVLNS